MRLLNDLAEYSNKEYHLGTIILHKRDNQYDIVDGQQRLVTLTLILQYLEYETALSHQTIFSQEATEYISYNKWLIYNFLKENKISSENLLTNLKFSVLKLTSSNLDLAYTFFTTNSSRGKALSDYDLLKSHHLRYIHLPLQAEHVAERWDDLIRQSDNEDKQKALARTFEICLFRLRKWMRKNSWIEDQKRKIKNHFEAASIIPEIPPFGEQFRFYESIQGGTHFFAFAEYFIYRFKEFQQTPSYKKLHEVLNWEYHWWYRDVMESLLFAYYLKFGNQYLSDAFFLISKYISKHRYENRRANLNSIFKFANDSEIVMMIDQATSPTFFLAELKNITDKIEIPSDLTRTRKNFQNNMNKIYKDLQSNLEILKIKTNDK
jgi:hypothetical protein